MAMIAAAEAIAAAAIQSHTFDSVESSGIVRYLASEK